MPYKLNIFFSLFKYCRTCVHLGGDGTGAGDVGVNVEAGHLLLICGIGSKRWAKVKKHLKIGLLQWINTGEITRFFDLQH